VSRRDQLAPDATAPRQVHPSKPPLRACQSARPDLTSDANKFRNWSWLVICPPMFSYSTTRQLRRKQPLSQCEHFDEAMCLCRFCLETGAWRPQVPKRYTTKSVEQPCGQPKQPRQRKTSSAASIYYPAKYALPGAAYIVQSQAESAGTDLFVPALLRSIPKSRVWLFDSLV
jgi:hypothetical protein